MPPSGPDEKSPPGPDVLCTSCGTDSLFVNVIVSPGVDGDVLRVELDVLHADLGAPAAGRLLLRAGAAATAAPAPVVVIVPAAGHEAEGEAGEHQGEELGHAAKSRCSRRAFWACRRFSASSHAAERSP